MSSKKNFFYCKFCNVSFLVESNEKLLKCNCGNVYKTLAPGVYITVDSTSENLNSSTDLKLIEEIRKQTICNINTPINYNTDICSKFTIIYRCSEDITDAHSFLKSVSRYFPCANVTLLFKDKSFEKLPTSGIGYLNISYIVHSGSGNDLFDLLRNSVKTELFLYIPSGLRVCRYTNLEVLYGLLFNSGKISNFLNSEPYNIVAPSILYPNGFFESFSNSGKSNSEWNIFSSTSVKLLDFIPTCFATLKTPEHYVSHENCLLTSNSLMFCPNEPPSYDTLTDLFEITIDCESNFRKNHYLIYVENETSGELIRGFLNLFKSKDSLIVSNVIINKDDLISYIDNYKSSNIKPVLLYDKYLEFDYHVVYWPWHKQKVDTEKFFSLINTLSIDR